VNNENNWDNRLFDLYNRMQLASCLRLYKFKKSSKNEWQVDA